MRKLTSTESQREYMRNSVATKSSNSDNFENCDDTEMIDAFHDTSPILKCI